MQEVFSFMIYSGKVTNSYKENNEETTRQTGLYVCC